MGRASVASLEPRRLLASILGSISNDANANGLLDAREPALAAVRVHADAANLGGHTVNVRRSQTADDLAAPFSGSGAIESTIGLVTDPAGDVFGTTQLGGAHKDGTLFEVKAGTNTVTTLHSFDGPDGADPNGLVIDAAGNVYGTTYDGGTINTGTLFELKTGTTTLTTLQTFDESVGPNIDGSYPGGLVIAPDGNLYGTTGFGGESLAGTIFELALPSHSLSTVVPFNDTDDPNNLAFDAAGDLYGTTYGGGTNHAGTVFEVKAGSNAETTLASFNDGPDDEDSADGTTVAALAADASGDVYGTTFEGGPSDLGTIFKVAAGSNAVTTLASFVAANGTANATPAVFNSIAQDGLIVGARGDLYGMTDSEVYELPAGGHTIEPLATYTQAGQVQGLVLNTAGALYLATFGSGADGNEASFTPVPLTPRRLTPSEAKPLVSFPLSDQYAQLEAVDKAGDLFGTGDNSVFEIKARSHSPTPVPFDAPFNAMNSAASLVMDRAGNLYGTTFGANLSDYVFKVKSGTSTAARLADVFSDEPLPNLVVDRAGDLFGRTTSDGGQFDGTLFEIKKHSRQATTLYTFDASDANPTSVAVDASGDLFGTTENGGGDNNGTLFELPKGSSDLTTLRAFNGSNGSAPDGLVVDAGGDLFGTTESGGADDDGTVFEVKAGTGAATTLASFDGSNGSEPFNGNYGGGNPTLVVDSSGNLYGMTFDGGAANDGTVFEVKAGSEVVSTVYSFTAADGANPIGLVIDAAGNLYCSTSAAGAFNAGTIIELPRIATSVAAAFSAPQINSATPTGTVTVTYSDPAGIKLSSITAAGLSVVSTGDIPLTVTRVTLNTRGGNPRSVTATYTIAAPGGQWSPADNGSYSIILNPGAVHGRARGTNAYASTSLAVDLPPQGAGPVVPSAANYSTPIEAGPQTVSSPGGPGA